MSIRIVLADDQPLVRAGIAMLLSAQEGMEIVGEASNGFEAVEQAKRLLPDLVIMDMRMPEMDGVEATRQLTSDEFTTERDRTVKVLALTTFHDDELVHQALRAGASGFVVKDSVPSDLVTAIRAVDAGNAYLHPRVTRRLIENFASRPAATTPDPGVLDRLTRKERQVLKSMAHGLSNKEIATRGHLAESTVKTHVSRIIMKLEVNDRTQAVVIAYQTRLVVPGEGLDF